MATEWISPTWRMPNDKNQSKFENYSLDFISTNSERIILDNSVDLGLNSTISLWVNFDSTGSVVLGEDSYSSNYLIYVDGTNIYIRINAVAVAFAHSMSTGQWYNIVAVRQGDSIEVFRNNTSLGTQTGYGTSVNTKFNAIGAKSDGTFPVNGKLSGIVGFDYALSESQRNYLYNSGTPQNPMAISGQPPIAYYPLGGSSTGSASTLTVPNESVADATVFDFPSGGADLINCGNKVDFTNAFTLSSWVKTDTTPASYIFYKNATFTVGKDTWYDGGVGNRARVTLTDSNGLSKDFRSNVAPAGATVTVGTVVDLKDDNWHQIVFSYDGVNQGKLYTDGALTYTYDITDGAWAGSLANNTNDLILGSNVTVQTWTGEMSNTQIWESVLTGTDVTTIYNNGVPLLSGTQPQAANLKAWYPMNVENANWLGSDWQIAEATSAYPQSFNFDSTSDIINSSTIDLGTTHTISMWVRITATSFANIITGTGGSAIKLNAPTKIYYYTNNYTNSQPSISMPLNQWNNIVIVRETTTVKFYVNNSLLHTTTSFAGDDFSFNKILGLDVNNQTSNIQLWNSALPATGSNSVETLYNNGSPLTTAIASSNLKGWYKLNNTANWNSSNWVIENSAITPNFDKAIDFISSSTQYVDLTNTGFPTSNAARTLSAWIKADSTGQNNEQGILKYGTTATRQLFMMSLAASNGQLRVSTYGDDLTYTTADLRDDLWHHVALTYDGTSIKGYVDGSYVGVETNTLVNTTANSPVIGNWNGAGFTFNGAISNVLLYTETLTDANIVTLYNNGTPQTTPYGSPFGWWKLDDLITGVQDSGSGGNDGTLVNSPLLTSTDVQAGDGISSGMTESNLVNNNVSALNGTSSGMTTANLVNSDLTRSIPYSSYSLNFDGGDWATPSISLNTLSASTAFSVSCWVKIDTNTNFDHLVGAPAAFDAWNTGFGLYLNGTGIRFWVEKWNGTNQYVETAALSTDQWYHITATFDTTNALKLYVDGATVTTASGTTIDGLTNTIYLGSTGANATYALNGNLNNVAIWNSELTQDQILSIYNGGVPNDISSLSPSAWWSLAGDSYYDGTNFILPDLSASSNNATTANMSGIELVGNAPGGSANGTGTSMDIPVNLKGDAPNSSSNAFSVNMNSADRVASVPS